MTTRIDEESILTGGGVESQTLGLASSVRQKLGNRGPSNVNSLFRNVMLRIRTAAKSRCKGDLWNCRYNGDCSC